MYRRVYTNTAVPSTFVVPGNVSSVTIYAQGGGGGSGTMAVNHSGKPVFQCNVTMCGFFLGVGGGSGGYVVATYSTVGISTLTIQVGTGGRTGLPGSSSLVYDTLDPSRLSVEAFGGTQSDSVGNRLSASHACTTLADSTINEQLTLAFGNSAAGTATGSNRQSSLLFPGNAAPQVKLSISGDQASTWTLSGLAGGAPPDGSGPSFSATLQIQSPGAFNTTLVQDVSYGGGGAGFGGLCFHSNEKLSNDGFRGGDGYVIIEF